MRPETFASGTLRDVERRVITCLRAFAQGQEEHTAFWHALGAQVGKARALDCRSGFYDMRALLSVHAWHPPLILEPRALGFSEDELALARFTMAATEQRRDVALEEASFLVSPLGILPLLTAATRFGLPLLCADCRLRQATRPAGLA